ncbi:NADPH-dependent 7-cyano-7-deazaguanine reductase QueF [Desulforhopalus sp. 52FAK]
MNNIPLGKEVSYISTYKPELLFPVPRDLGREAIGLQEKVPFFGQDIWNAYEISWLEPGGKPRIAIAEIVFSIESLNIVESKSLKLYLNSFNQTRFHSPELVSQTIEKDLKKVAVGDVRVDLKLPGTFEECRFNEPQGLCIDDVQIETDCYSHNTSFLICEEESVEECIYSNLLRSNCPVTGQPDWGTVIIDYSGQAISHRGLLRYIISFREHTGFHENCVEQIFVDLMNHCSLEKLSVYARFTRRGGIDINPFRSTEESCLTENNRTARQ